MIRIIPGRPAYYFRCIHCRTIFQSDEWKENSKGIFEVCPNCHKPTNQHSIYCP